MGHVAIFTKMKGLKKLIKITVYGFKNLKINNICPQNAFIKTLKRYNK